MIAIIFCSKYGTTRKICSTIKRELDNSDSVQLIDLEDRSATVDISRFHTVILGTSIYAGHPSKRMVEFCKQYMEELLQKRLALFVCGMDRNNATHEIDASYPKEILSKAVSSTFFDGEYQLDKMNFPDRMLLRVFFKVKESQTRAYEEDVKLFIQSLMASTIIDNLKQTR